MLFFSADCPSTLVSWFLSLCCRLFCGFGPGLAFGLLLSSVLVVSLSSVMAAALYFSVKNLVIFSNLDLTICPSKA